MEKLNSVNTQMGVKGLEGEASITQSLDQLVKRKLKETAKNLKRKLDDSIPTQHSTTPSPMPERSYSELQMDIGRCFGRGHEKRMALAMPDSQSSTVRPVTSSVSFADEGAVQTHLKPTQDRGGNKVSQISTAHRDGAALLTQRETPVTRDSLTSDAARSALSLTPHRVEVEKESAIQSALKHSSSAAPLTASAAIGEHDDVAFMTVSSELSRHAATQSRSAEVFQPSPPRPAPFADVMATRLMQTPQSEPVSNNQLVYRFAEWGDGHQVNVQLGGHAKAPHVLQVSDPLVHQRLADYDGQGQGEPEWVFSDEQEQPKKQRHQHMDEDTA